LAGMERDQRLGNGSFNMKQRQTAVTSDKFQLACNTELRVELFDCHDFPYLIVGKFV